MGIGDNLKRLLGKKAVQNAIVKTEQETAEAVERDVTDSLRKLAGKADDVVLEGTPSAAPKVSPTYAEELASQATDYTKPFADEMVSGSPSRLKQLGKAGIGLGTAGLAGYALFGGDSEPPVTPVDAAAPQAKEPMMTPAMPMEDDKKPASMPAAPAKKTKAASSMAKSLEKKEEAPAQEAEKPAVAQEVAKPEEKFLDFGTAEQNKNEFEDAQRRQDEAILVNQLGKAGEIIGSGISRSKPVAQEAFDQNIKLAQNITKEYLDKQAQEENDPASGTSKAARDYIKQFGINVSDGATATQLKQVMPYVFKDFEAKQAAQARKEILESQLAAQKEMARDKIEQRKFEAEQRSKDRQLGYAKIAEERKAREETKRLDRERRSNEDLMKDIGGSRQLPNVRQAYLDKYNVQKLKPLLDLGDKASPQMLNLVTFEAAKVAAGKAPTEGEFKALSPQTIPRTMAEVAGKFLNEPTAANAGKFLNEVKHYAEDLEKNANRTIKGSVASKIEGRKRYLSPEDYEYALERFVKNPEKYEEGGDASAGTISLPDMQKQAQAELLRRASEKDKK